MQTTRRGFIQGAAVAAGSTSAPWLASLAAIGDAAAQSAGDGAEYKALVCLFMLGGNDHPNTLVPMDEANYAEYRSQRPEIYYRRDRLMMGGTEGDSGSGVPIFIGMPPVVLGSLQDNLLPDSALNGRQFSLAPPMTPLKKHYSSGKLAVMLNVGPLIEPTVGVLNPSNNTIALRPLVPGTATVDMTRFAQLPQRLGSHNDQTIVWGSEQGGAGEGSTAGWGGLIADTVSQGNTTSVFNGISAGGSTVFLSGNSSNAYQVTTSNSIAVTFDSLRSPIYGSAVVSNVLGQIITGSGTVSSASHVMEQDLVRVTKRAISSGDILRGIPIDQASSINGANPYAPLEISGNPLASQLRTVAHLINNRGTTGAKRQVFYVAMGGFDTHSGVPTAHPGLTARVAQAMDAFQQVMETLQMSNQVTLFTASEFGRTLNANGDGSDHGWGSMHFVLGGAVNGGRFYGKAPVFGNRARRPDGLYDDTTRGSLIPTTSVAQYAATLARWMGVPDNQLDAMLPNLKNFNPSRDLGFLKKSV